MQIMNEELTLGLTNEQREAVSHFEGPMLVLAGAGSGKTRAVTARIACLIESGIPASSIVAVTFTNKAAAEMKERIRKMINQNVLIATFHSLGARILRESAKEFSLNPSFTIYDQDDQEKLIKECLKEEGAEVTSREVKELQAFISNCKNALIIPSEKEPLAYLFDRYQEKLKLYGAVDFDDLIYLTTLSLKAYPEVLKNYQARWRFFMIDEYQDTNHAQYELIKQLVGEDENVFAVGDPDQSIYSWRGSTIRNILQFESDFEEAKLVRLEENFRSTSTILNAANSLIENNRNRYEKRLWSSLGEGEKISLFTGGDEKEEASFVAETIKSLSTNGISYDEIGVFYRTNAQSRAFEDELLIHSVPYTIIGGVSFYQRKEIKDVLSFLKMTESDQDFLAFLRTINLPKKGIGEASLVKIQEGWTVSGKGIIPFLKEIVSGEGLYLTKKPRDGLLRYVGDIEALRVRKEGAVADLLSYAIHDTGYLESMKNDDNFDERKENLNELFAKGLEWDMRGGGPLSSFLEEVTLKTSVHEEHTGSVKLMTLHNSKGLEFPAVFVVGVEEDLLPHVNSRESNEKVEEERRLFYVGMTRAKQKLYLCRCLFRSIWGQERTQRKSRFLEEIDPSTLMRADKRGKAPQKASHVEYIEEEQEFKPGDKVMHKDFGIGEVKHAEMTSLGLVYKVYFIKTGSSKSLVAKYAPLHRLG